MTAWRAAVDSGFGLSSVIAIPQCAGRQLGSACMAAAKQRPASNSQPAWRWLKPSCTRAWTVSVAAVTAMVAPEPGYRAGTKPAGGLIHPGGMESATGGTGNGVSCGGEEGAGWAGLASSGEPSWTPEGGLAGLSKS